MMEKEQKKKDLDAVEEKEKEKKVPAKKDDGADPNETEQKIEKFDQIFQEARAESGVGDKRDEVGQSPEKKGVVAGLNAKYKDGEVEEVVSRADRNK